MTNEALPKIDTSQEIEGNNNPASARVIALVDVGTDNYLSETGLYQRQTHSKDGTHYFAAYNPHKDQDTAAECFVIVTPLTKEKAEKYRWVAIEGPSAEEANKVGAALTSFEKLIGTSDG